MPPGAFEVVHDMREMVTAPRRAGCLDATQWRASRRAWGRGFSVLSDLALETSALARLEARGKPLDQPLPALLASAAVSCVYPV